MEILLVVGIIAILAGIVIVAINPSKQLATVRNAERKSDVKQIDSAILQYYIDNFRYPAGITSDLKEVCNTGSVSSTTVAVDSTACGSLVNLSKLVPDYITAIPKDPRATSTGNGTGYYVKEDATTHKIGTKALLAELDQDININAASGTVAQEEASTLGVDLVNHWKMNDTSCDTVTDTKGNDGTGTCTGNQSGATANTGTSMGFNGSSDYVEASNPLSISGNIPWSVSLWANLDSYIEGWGGSLFSIGEQTSLSCFSLQQYGSDNTIFINPWDGGYMYFISNTIPLVGQWNLYTVTFDGTDVTVYLNETQIDKRSLPLNFISSNFYIGGRTAGYDGQYANGKIDDVRIYDRALTEGEIAELAAGTEAE